MEDGGRAKAERDFREYGGHTALRKQDANGGACKSEEKKAEPKVPDEPMHVYVSGRMVQSLTPRHSGVQQLQTPPNTFVEKKKERPPSWNGNEESRKKARYVGKNGTTGGATAPRPERISIDSTTCPALSVTTSFYGADGRSIDQSSRASAAALSSYCSDFASNDADNDDPSSSDDDSASPSSDGYNKHKLLVDPIGSSDVDGRKIVDTSSGDNSGPSTTLLDIRDSEYDFTSKKLYPQLPMRKSLGCPDRHEVAALDGNITAENLDVIADHFRLSQDYISFDISSDPGDFPDEATGLNNISAKGPRTGPPLCGEQLALVDLIMNGQNVFYTGSAGCGKSTVLKHFVHLLRVDGKKVDILAPTGRAALEINGRTLHNYAGWVPRSLGQPLSKLKSKAHGKKVRKRLNATDVLIIDEVSMVANLVFERLNCIMKTARGSEQPFGGVQMIVTGDFCQLPPVHGFEYCFDCGTALGPVSSKGDYKCVGCPSEFEEINKWAFRSAAWRECGFEHVNLKVIHRQKDAKFRALLEKSRLGLPYSIRQRRVLTDHASDTRDAVRLFPKREEVKRINDTELARLPGRALTYSCVDDFYCRPEHDYLGDKNIRCPKPMSHALEALEDHFCESTLVLKEGMLVMLVVNWDLESSLANGSQGTIVGFEKHDPSKFPEVPRSREYSSRKNGLLRVFVKRTAVQEWPIVQFLNGKRRSIYPRCMIHELGDEEPYSLLSRTQIPLVAAWAMTIHKAEGMTLSRVIVDLRHTFEPGQDYVALSRAETLRGLKVEGLPETDPRPNKQVMQFLKENHLMPAIDWVESDNETGDEVEEDG